MEVQGQWVEVFEGSDRQEDSGGEGELLGSSTITLAPLVANPPPPPIRRSQPLVIHRSRMNTVERFSVPSIPNPFPELCSPSQSPVLIGSLSPPRSDTHLIKVFGEDSHSRSLWVIPRATARDVCHLLVQTTHCSDQENWALIELHSALGLERVLEDHEVVVEVQAAWPSESDTKLLFRKNYAKYEFFRTPVVGLLSSSASSTILSRKRSHFQAKCMVTQRSA